MNLLFRRIFEDMWLWAAWIVIPILFEIIPSLIQTVRLLTRKPKPHFKRPQKMPFITIVVPVYNSAKTLFACLESIAYSTYDTTRIQIIAVDNQSVDESFHIFQKAQKALPALRMQWMSTPKGKSRAINAALYSSHGAYVIHVDSDGIFHPNAIENVVLNFENNPDVDALTGVILTQKEMIETTKRPFLKLLRLSEYFEYAQAFFAGRNIESHKNELFTMSGAFSAFRKSVLLDTHLYSLDTVGEDTDITFQIRQRLKGRVALCDDALFLVDPIEGLEQLYLQRQRWQRGEIEVSHLYMKTLSVKNLFNDFMIRRLIVDHTFAFPRFIWIFAVFALMYYDYTVSIVFGSFLVMYLLYCLNGLINYLSVLLLLKPFKEERRFYARHGWVLVFQPFYNLLCFIIRFVGIVNATLLPAAWRGKSFKEEMGLVKQQIAQDLNFKNRQGGSNHD